MSGNKCEYYLCGKSKRRFPSLRTFTFPVNNPTRCKDWIRNSGNALLALLTPESLKKKVLCSDHFQEKDLLAKKLSTTAVPIHFKDLPSNVQTYSKKVQLMSSPVDATVDISEENFSLEDSCWVNELVDLPSTPKKERTMSKRKYETSANDDTPRKIKLRKQVESCKLKLKSKSSKISYLKKKIKKKSTFTTLYGNDLNMLSPMSKSLVTMQLFHRKRTAWTNDEKKTAISIYYKSPSSYKFLRKSGVILPSVSAIKGWIGKFNCKAGLNKHLLKFIKLKSSTMLPQELKCVILFDEMAIKRMVEYSKSLDLIEGFEDLGQFGKRPVPAKQALVLLIRGIFSTWKIPVAYFLSETGVKADHLKLIILETIKNLEDSGLRPLAITCDQSTTNQKLFKLLGISPETPYFTLNDQNYYGLFDAPHLLKSVRNNMLPPNKFKLSGKDLCFNDVIQLHEIDKSSGTGKSIPRITGIHLHPNAFQKMNVRLAAQVFSHSVYAAMKTAIQSNQLVSESASQTAEFIKDMDNLFDALNSRKQFSAKLCNRPLGEKNVEVIQALEKGLQIFQSLVKVDIRGYESRPPSFDGVLITINGLRLLQKQEAESGFPYILTSRLNQDVLENQFSIYRQRGGYNRNPTARLFRCTFKLNTILNLMKPPRTSNCEPDTDQHFFSNELLENSDKLDTCEASDHSSLTGSSSESDNEEDNQGTLEDCAVKYFAGYLLKKCLDHFNCKHCKDTFQGKMDLQNKNDLLLLQKSYGVNQTNGLKTPSQILERFTKLSMVSFYKYMHTYRDKLKIGSKLKSIIEDQINQKLPEWSSHECKDHKNYIINLLIRTLIYKECKNISYKETAAFKKGSKISILQNL